MLQITLLIGLLLVATVTDLVWRKIYNWTTYPGIAVGLLLSGLASLFQFDIVNGSLWATKWLGILPFRESLLGFLACAAVMLICYIFFAGGVGGGDVKLIAMIGTYLGVSSGLEAMLWTFVWGACFALMSLVWRYGPWQVVSRCVRVMLHKLRLGSAFQLSEVERKPLKTELYLSPSALLGVLIVIGTSS